jgi:hypothetical protein
MHILKKKNEQDHTETKALAYVKLHQNWNEYQLWLVSVKVCQ